MRKIGLCGIAALLAVLVACGGGSSTTPPPPPPPPPTPSLVSIDLTPTGPGIEVGHIEQFTATGHFDDGSTQDLTSTAAWTSSDTAVATINSAGQATGVAAGAVTVTVTDSSISNSTTLNVVAAPGPTLNGSYAFTLMGADTRGTQFYAGSFTADGSGNISGAVDANTGAGIQQNVAVSGTYTMFSDGRGTIVLNSPGTLTLRFVLSSGGAAGKLIEFDGLGTLKGSFKQQAGASSLDLGRYVFLLSGPDAASGSMGQVGIFDTDGITGITGGEMDANDAGTITNAALITADLNAYTDPDANGRGTLRITTAAGAANYVYYAIDSDNLNLVQVDASPSSALGGIAALQDPGLSFTDADLNGGFAFELDHPVIVAGPNSVADRGELDTIGRLQFDGAGALSAGIQDEDHDQRVFINNIGGTYNISGSAGRGRVIEVAPSFGETFILYMVSAEKMFMLHTLNGANPVVTPAVGVAEKQSGGPFGVGTLNGSYALSGSELTEGYIEVLAQLSFDGTGNVIGIADISDHGTLSSKPVNKTYTTAPNPGSGRGEFGPPLGSPDAFTDYVIYLVSPNKAWSVGADRPNFEPDTVGSIELQ